MKTLAAILFLLILAGCQSPVREAVEPEPIASPPSYKVNNSAQYGLIPVGVGAYKNILMDIHSETDARFFEPTLAIDRTVKAGETLRLNITAPPGDYLIKCVEGCNPRRSVFNLSMR